MKIQDSSSKTNLFFGTLSYNPWAILATWLHLALKITKNLNSQTVLNIELFPTYTKSKLNMFGIVGELVNYAVHL
jgi:hypothetical protein